MRIVWRFRAWGDPALEARFVADGFLAMSADELGDLSSQPSDELLARKLEEAHAHDHDGKGAKPGAIGVWVKYWRTLLSDMEVGDPVVLARSEQQYSLGRITSGYEYVAAEPDPYCRHRRRVDWELTGPKSRLPENVKRVVNAPGTVCRINDPSGLSGI